jgi:hypothetical protein
MFIQFAEKYFKDYAADRLYKPTVKSYLVRIPATLNSKCIAKQQDAEVKIIENGMALDRQYNHCLGNLEYGLFKRESMTLKS